MVKNKNKDEDEHYNIKEHYDNPYENVDAKNVSWIPIICGILIILLFLVAFCWWARDRIKEYFYPTNKTKTEVLDSKELTTVNPVISADSVHPSIGVARNATQTASTTVKPLNYPPTQILIMNPNKSTSFRV